jgi:hypothetical protein
MFGGAGPSEPGEKQLTFPYKYFAFMFKKITPKINPNPNAPIDQPIPEQPSAEPKKGFVSSLSDTIANLVSKTSNTTTDVITNNDTVKSLMTLNPTQVEEPKTQTIITPVEPTPAEPTPTEPTPAEPIPEEPTPAEPTPAEPIPVEPTPAEPIPVEPTPAEPTPVEPTPAEPTPAEPTPPTPVEKKDTGFFSTFTRILTPSKKEDASAGARESVEETVSSDKPVEEELPEPTITESKSEPVETPVSIAPVVEPVPEFRTPLQPASFMADRWVVHIPLSEMDDRDIDDIAELDNKQFEDVLNFNEMERRNGIYVRGEFHTILGRKVKIGYVEELNNKEKKRTIAEYLSGRPVLEGTLMKKYAAINKI